MSTERVHEAPSERRSQLRLRFMRRGDRRVHRPVAEQEYVEDCPVCCCPNVVRVEVDEDGEVRVWASRDDAMLPLYRDSWFTFRFTEDRSIPRFHLDGIEAGRRVSIIKIDADTGERLGLLATATVGEDGWVSLAEPIIVRAGEAFIAVPVTHQLTLAVLPDAFAVCRLDAGAAVPPWATTSQFFSITRTSDELSVVCPQNAVPDNVRCGRDWRCLRVSGKMDFSMIGVVASLVTPLAEAGVSVFVISTFDTDYLLVKENDLAKAMAVLRAAGHTPE